MGKDITIKDLEAMGKDFLDLLPDGWSRHILFESSKLSEESGEVAE